MFQCEDSAHLYVIELSDEIIHGLVLISVAVIYDPQQVNEASLSFDAQTASGCICQIRPDEYLHTVAFERLKPPQYLNAVLCEWDKASVEAAFVCD